MATAATVDHSSDNQIVGLEERMETQRVAERVNREELIELAKVVGGLIGTVVKLEAEVRRLQRKES